VPGGA
jgi:hypothetical protein